MSVKPQPEVFRVVLDCVTGEKLIFRRELRDGQPVEIQLEKKVVKVAPESLWLTIRGLHLEK